MLKRLERSTTYRTCRLRAISRSSRSVHTTLLIQTSITISLSGRLTTGIREAIPRATGVHLFQGKKHRQSRSLRGNLQCMNESLITAPKKIEIKTDQKHVQRTEKSKPTLIQQMKEARMVGISQQKGTPGRRRRTRWRSWARTLRGNKKRRWVWCNKVSNGHSTGCSWLNRLSSFSNEIKLCVTKSL